MCLRSLEQWNKHGKSFLPSISLLQLGILWRRSLSVGQRGICNPPRGHIYRCRCQKTQVEGRKCTTGQRTNWVYFIWCIIGVCLCRYSWGIPLLIGIAMVLRYFVDYQITYPTLPFTFPCLVVLNYSPFYYLQIQYHSSHPFFIHYFPFLISFRFFSSLPTKF